MIEQILIESIISKAFELVLKKVDSLNRRMDENQTFDLLCERLLKEYKEKLGEDDVLFKKFYTEGNDRVMGLKDIIDNQAPAREMFPNILRYISEQTGIKENDSRIKDFATMLISELMFTEEFRKKMCEYRRDIESFETNTNVNKILEMLNTIIGLIENYVKKDSDDIKLHQLTRPPMKYNELIHRDDTVNELVQLIETGENVVLVNGLGGIGKTSIAGKIYHNIKDRYRHIAWIEYQESLKKSLLSSIYIYDGITDDEMRYRRIEQFLVNSKGNTILFIDNVNKTVSEDQSLKLLSEIDARVVITSRMQNMYNFTPVNIGFLSTEQCIDVFYEYYKYDNQRSNTETVRELVNLVSCHTLSVELLAKSANIPGYVLSDFFEDLKRNGFGYPDLLVESNHTLQADTIAEHLKKLFELVNVNEEQKRILKNFAILPSMEIPAEIKKWVECKSGDLMKLNELGWISATENNYMMHDIVRKAIRLQDTISINDCMQLIKNLSKNDYIKKTDDYITAAVRMKIGDTVINEFINEKTEDMGCLLNNIAASHQDRGEYNKALEWYQKTLTIDEKVLGKEHPSTATTYNNIAAVYSCQGDYTKALEWYQKALTIDEKVLGKEHPSTATTYNNIAFVYYRQGDYPKALEWYQKALTIYEKVLGKEHPSTATIYNNIAGVYDRQGDYPKALEWYQKALTIDEKVLGKEHPSTASTYNNIALVYSYQGDYPKALKLNQKALDIREKVLGKDHPSTAITYNSIAFVYSCQGDYPKALEWYQKALDISEKVLGKEHPNTATTYNKIAGVYESQGDYPKALEWYHEALDISEKVLGKEHPDTATTYNNIAFVYSRQGDYPKALEWYQKTLDIREKVLGKEHPDTATTYNNIALVYSRQGDYPKALEWYQKDLDISEKVLGKEHPDTATTYNNIALVYSCQGDYPKALEWFFKAFYVLIKVLGFEHLNTETVLDNTYSTYIESGKDEAGFMDWLKERLSEIHKEMTNN